MNRLARTLKSSKLLYTLYFYLMSGLLRVLGLFIRMDKQLILFNSYGGKKYDDSPKAIYEKMIQDKRFDTCKLVWSLQRPGEVEIPGRATVVKADSFKYFVTALKARVWITNSSMERGLSFKKTKTLCFNTWHGTAIKHMGKDIPSNNQSFKSKVLVRADIMLAQSQYDIDVFSRAFQLPLSCFQMTGLPRNDVLANYTEEDVEEIKDKIGLDKSKKVLLYAPTFREYSKESSNEVVLDIPMQLKRWQEDLGDKYVVLFRAHYEVSKHMKVDGYPMFIDMSTYPNLNDLMIISDALISDYSSIYFDYSIMNKPMYCFAYDYDEYISSRGMYISLKDELPCVIHRSEEGLIKELKEPSSFEKTIRVTTESFQKKYVTEYGRGANNSCDLLAQILRNTTRREVSAVDAN